MATPSELFDWQVRYLDIYLFYYITYGLELLSSLQSRDFRAWPLYILGIQLWTAYCAISYTRPNLADVGQDGVQDRSEIIGTETETVDSKTKIVHQCLNGRTVPVWSLYPAVPSSD